MNDRRGSLSWSDEFTGRAGDRPSRQHWAAEIGGGGWGDGQVQWYTDSPANAALTAEGHLAITARREAGREGRDGPPAGTITSARLQTKGLVATTFGRIAARIRVPRGRGIWAAFWMLGSDIDAVGWPRCGEIDVMEFVGSEPTVIHGTAHGPGYAGLGGGIGRAHDAGVDLAADFHIYAVDWTAERITWLLDDRPYHTLTPADVPGGAWPFRHDFFLLLNLAIGGNWPGNGADDPPLPATMLIDWVRIDVGNPSSE